MHKRYKLINNDFLKGFKNNEVNLKNCIPGFQP